MLWIHGWAANSHVFTPLRDDMPQSWQIRTPDLPGHGAAPDNGVFDIIAIADALAAEIDEQQPADVLGWSLGGLVALHLRTAIRTKCANSASPPVSPNF